MIQFTFAGWIMEDNCTFLKNDDCVVMSHSYYCLYSVLNCMYIVSSLSNWIRAIGPINNQSPVCQQFEVEWAFYIAEFLLKVIYFLQYISCKSIMNGRKNVKRIPHFLGFSNSISIAKLYEDAFFGNLLRNYVF